MRGKEYYYETAIIVMKLINSGSCTCNKSSIIPQEGENCFMGTMKKLWKTLTFFIYKNQRYTCSI